jgi:hypothetical protein
MDYRPKYRDIVKHNIETVEIKEKPKLKPKRKYKKRKHSSLMTKQQEKLIIAKIKKGDSIYKAYKDVTKRHASGGIYRYLRSKL